MANSFVDPKLAAATSLELIKSDLVLGRTVYRDAERDFGGKVGDTVTVRRPGRRQHRILDRAVSNNVVLDDLDNDGVPIKLDSHIYNGAKVTDEEMTLTIEDFTREVVQPITTAVAEGIEETLVTAMQAVTESATLADIEGDGSNIKAVWTAARKELRDAKTPAGGLFAACGTAVYAAALASSELSRVDATGDADALRNASIGRLYGFTTVESNMLDDEEVVFYHMEAFSLAVRVPVVPDGVTWGAGTTEGGYGLRLIKDYDPGTLSDRVIGSVLAGADVLTSGWALRKAGLAA